jgi:hypothetical protein
MLCACLGTELQAVLLIHIVYAKYSYHKYYCYYLVHVQNYGLLLRVDDTAPDTVKKMQIGKEALDVLNKDRLQVHAHI